KSVGAVYLPIRFAFGSADLDTAGIREAETVANFLLSNKVHQLTVVGHTDEVGSEAFNLDLSLRRAQTVKHFLIAKGVTAQIHVDGKGESEPPKLVDYSIYSEEERRAIARRVELAKHQALVLIAALCVWGVPVGAAQFGMVVGVDDYRHFQPFPAPVGELSDLEGAVNDAERIAASMRRAGIDLPDDRFLTDERANVDNFLAGWRAMTAKAQAGDTIIVSFSGHGGQEREVAEPFDEKTDGLDETIMFHDFDPSNP
ncbi:unnamed protein product, partial [Cyprideis torosa]